jgi:hypothetical protein
MNRLLFYYIVVSLFIITPSCSIDDEVTIVGNCEVTTAVKLDSYHPADKKLSVKQTIATTDLCEREIVVTVKRLNIRSASRLTSPFHSDVYTLLVDTSDEKIFTGFVSYETIIDIVLWGADRGEALSVEVQDALTGDVLDFNVYDA